MKKPISDFIKHIMFAASFGLALGFSPIEKTPITIAFFIGLAFAGNILYAFIPSLCGEE